MRVWSLSFSFLEAPPPHPLLGARPLVALFLGDSIGVHLCHRETCGCPLPRRGWNTVLSLHPELSLVQACPRLSFRAGPV